MVCVVANFWFMRIDSHREMHLANSVEKSSICCLKETGDIVVVVVEIEVEREVRLYLC